MLSSGQPGYWSFKIDNTDDFSLELNVLVMFYKWDLKWLLVTFSGLFHWMLIYWVITTSTRYTLLMFYNMRMCKVKNETCMAFQWSWILMNMVKIMWPVQFSHGRECRLNAEYVYSSQHLIFLGFRLTWSF